jgi:uncharacterized protein (TIGR03435 family)
MNRLRCVVAVAALWPCVFAAQQSSEAPSLAPMAADADPSVDAATIRPSIPGDRRPPVIQIQKRRWMAINRTVMELITYSHALHRRQVLNAPSWLDEQYDITAQPDGEGQPSQRQWHAMVRTLLADRFKLSSHTETRDVSVYVLSVKDGPRALSPGTGAPAGPANLAMRAQGRFAAGNASMADLASELGAFLDRPVVDRTGISGRYNFTLLWTVDEFQSARLKAFPVPQRGSVELPSLFTAIQEQLGLKLDPATAAASVLVIDRIERPSEN